MNLPRLTYDQSKRAYELGFAEITDWWLDKDSQKRCHISDMGGFFKNHYANPENQLFLMWCREVKGIECGVMPDILTYTDFNPKKAYRGGWSIPGEWKVTPLMPSHTQAETALIDYLLDLLEKKTK